MEKKSSSTFKPYPCLEGNIFAGLTLAGFSLMVLLLEIQMFLSVYP
jgi:hypothetical protein